MSYATRPIPSAPGYEATDDGRILTTGHKDRLGREFAPRFVILRAMANGYLTANIRGKRANGSTPCLVNRLVCEAFHGPAPHPNLVARHKDGNRTNNRPDNLAWATQLENIGDKAIHGTQTRGSNHGTSRIDEDTVRLIRRELNAGVSQVRIAHKFGVTQSNISAIALGKTWAHVKDEQ